MLESNKQVFQKRKHTELLVAGFWKPAVPHLVLNPGVGTLLEGKYGNSRVLNAIYTLIEHTYLSTTNSKQSVIKHQSQERVWRKVKKHVFNHCWSSHTLQRYNLFIFSDILCCWSSCCFLVLVKWLFNGFLSISLLF